MQYELIAFYLTKQMLSIPYGTEESANCKCSKVVWLSHSHTCCSDHDLILGKIAVTGRVSCIRGLNPIMWPADLLPLNPQALL